MGEEGEGQGQEEEEEEEDIVTINPKLKIIESKVMNALKKNFDLALTTAKTVTKIDRGDDNWYKHCGITMQKLIKDYNIPEDEVLDFLVEHLVDMTMYDEKIEILNYIFLKDVIPEKSFESYVKKYLDKKIIKSKSLTGIILFSGTTRKVMILNGKKWVDAEPEDISDLSAEIKQKYKISPGDFNNLVGFIGYENKNKYLVFKVKDMLAKRNTGARCDESRKTNKLQILNELVGKDVDGKDKYTKESTRGVVQAELCSLQEFLYRYKNKESKKINGKTFFLDFETAMIYNF